MNQNTNYRPAGHRSVTTKMKLTAGQMKLIKRKVEKTKTAKNAKTGNNSFSSAKSEKEQKSADNSLDFSVNSDNHKKLSSLALGVKSKLTGVSLFNEESKKQEFTFAETLKIISEIQKQFESSVTENKKPLEEIKRLIDNDLTIENYIALSETQKEIITKDIERSSELRIQNYTTVFNYIKTSLDSIQKCLEVKVGKEKEEEEEEEEDDYVNSSDENISGSSGEGQIIVSEEDSNNGPNYNTYREPKVMSIEDGVGDEETDFSEGVMLENALVLPPKNSPFNYQNVKDMTRTRSKKFSVLGNDKRPKFNEVRELKHKKSTDKESKELKKKKSYDRRGSKKKSDKKITEMLKGVDSNTKGDDKCYIF